MAEQIHVAELVGIIIGLMLIAAVTVAGAKRLKLPPTVVLVLVGMVLVPLADYGPKILLHLVQYNISPEVILFVFLPTLIFESAFNLDFRQLRRNLWPVLTLAIPGLILSTVLIGLIVAAFTPIPLGAALLLGSILSATDPVAVISLFKQLGAPKRLTVLVEGESLFNDATSIVVARILMGVVAAGYFSSQTALDGLVDFFVVFFGGIAVGWLAGIIAGFVLEWVEGGTFFDISLTTILAYFSFLVAEEAFHVSGVMATVAAGITMGNWGRTKISPAVTGYLESFWEYMANLANALIFLLVGLRVDLGALAGSLDLLVWVVVAMLISRGVVIFGLVPVTGLLPGVEKVDSRYRTVMYWGGLRGAIALAIVLSLDDFAYRDTFVALVMGAVLFTLLVQGLSIEKLMKWLGLDQPPLADRLSRTEGLLTAKRHALESIPELQTGGLFSARIAEKFQKVLNHETEEVQKSLKKLRSGELNSEQERWLLFDRNFSKEKTLYYEFFSKGHLSEQAFRDLNHSLDLQLEAVRSSLELPHFTLHPPEGHPWYRRLAQGLSGLPGFSRLWSWFNVARIARDYEEAWGRCQVSGDILAELDQMELHDLALPEILAEVRIFYKKWYESAARRVDDVAAQFPEFTAAMQERLAGRLLMHAQWEVIAEKARTGIIPPEVAKKMKGELMGQVRRLKGRDLAQLELDPGDLLRKVPFFCAIEENEFAQMLKTIKPHTLPAGEVVIRQGEGGDSLFLIGRGVIRVSCRREGKEWDLATLLAGDFFGEMALLHQEPRTATCMAVTPCLLYELKREAFDKVRQFCPGIQAALEAADKKRAGELLESAGANG